MKAKDLIQVLRAVDPESEVTIKVHNAICRRYIEWWKELEDNDLKYNHHMMLEEMSHVEIVIYDDNMKSLTMTLETSNY